MAGEDGESLQVRYLPGDVLAQLGFARVEVRPIQRAVGEEVDIDAVAVVPACGKGGAAAEEKGMLTEMSGEERMNGVEQLARAFGEVELGHWFW